MLCINHNTPRSEKKLCLKTFFDFRKLIIVLLVYLSLYFFTYKFLLWYISFDTKIIDSLQSSPFQVPAKEWETHISAMTKVKKLVVHPRL